MTPGEWIVLSVGLLLFAGSYLWRWWQERRERIWERRYLLAGLEYEEVGTQVEMIEPRLLVTTDLMDLSQGLITYTCDCRSIEVVLFRSLLTFMSDHRCECGRVVAGRTLMAAMQEESERQVQAQQTAAS